MDNSIWLMVGVGAMAFVIGYLAGGSKSPVVSAMIASLFALVTLATGVLTGNDFVKKLDEVKATVVTRNATTASIQKTLDDYKDSLPKSSGGTSTSSSDLDKKLDDVGKKIEGVKAAIATDSNTNREIEKAITDLSARAKQAPLYIGIILTVFAASFMLGAFTGTKARADEWFRPKRKFPWGKQTNQIPMVDLISWLAVQEKLLGLGYTRAEIQSLYGEWATPTSRESMKDIITALSSLPTQPIDVPPVSLISNIQKPS